MSLFLTLTINGALMGLLYALIAIGFSVIYRASKVFNIAQGELVVLGGFLVWLTVTEFKLPLYLALPLSLALAVVSGYLIERLFFKRLVGESVFAMVMMSIALLIFMRGFMLVVFGPDVRSFPAIIPTKPFIIHGVMIIKPLLFGGIITVAVALGLSYFFNHTRAGLSLTAVAENHRTALDLGISVRRASMIAWIMGMALATLGSIVYMNGGSINFLASGIGFIAIPVALLAGLEAISGMLVAGIVIGVAEKLTAGYLDPIIGANLASVLPYLLMLLILTVLPSGFFGWKTIERI
jgi:branched-chain amino acid transport system permease protein